jgi:DNA-binding response OmpR family regulator
VRALLRRAYTPKTPDVIRHKALEIDTATRAVTYKGAPVGLRRLEYLLLAQLGRDPMRIYTKSELLQQVWGYPADDCTRTVDTHACRVRRKLAHAGAHGWVPVTWGVGYRLAP